MAWHGMFGHAATAGHCNNSHNPSFHVLFDYLYIHRLP